MTTNRSAPGRGPGRFHRWYEVRLFDGAAFRGLYVAVDPTAKDRAKHALDFRLEDGSHRTVLYGDLEAAIPLNPTIRKARGLRT